MVINLAFALDLQAIAHPAVEADDVLVAEAIVNRQHGQGMAHLVELRQRRAANALGRRVAGDKLGVGGFEFLQRAEQLVVLGVRYGRIVEHVVGVVMAGKLGAQLGCAGHVRVVWHFSGKQA